MLSEADLRAAIKRVALFLNPGGTFAFDMRTAYYYEEALGDRTFTDEADGNTYIWKNRYDAETGIHKFNVQFSTPEGIFTERHQQRGYKAEAVAEAVRQADLEIRGVYDNYISQPASEQSERAVWICCKAK
jgi:hypothetical protein